jgi:hypothetical protein
MGHTRLQLRDEVAALFDMHEDTATGGSTTTLVDAKLARFADDYWNGAQVYVKTDAGGANAAPEGEDSWVTDFVGATGTLTLSPELTQAPAAGDTYQLYRWVTKDEIDKALARACVGGEVATSLTPQTDTLDYILTDAVGLLRRQQMIGVWRRRSGEATDAPQPVQGWSMEDAEGVLTLRLPYTLSSDDQLWIVYTAGETYLNSDTRSTNLPKDLLIARAAVYLIQRMVTTLDLKALEVWGQKLRYWNEQREAEERKYQRPSGRAVGVKWGELLGDAGGIADSGPHQALHIVDIV